jgi:hypothetical protein
LQPASLRLAAEQRRGKVDISQRADGQSTPCFGCRAQTGVGCRAQAGVGPHEEEFVKLCAEERVGRRRPGERARIVGVADTAGCGSGTSSSSTAPATRRCAAGSASERRPKWT